MIAHENQGLKNEFIANGYFVIRNFFSEDEIDRLREEIICTGKKLETSNELNKDGLIFYSNLFYKSPYLQSFISQAKIIDVLTQVVGTDVWVRWDQCVAKGPHGCSFPWHQDNAYNHLKDEHYQFWVAISEMTEENGGLWLQPGSHKLGLLPHEEIQHHLSCTVQPRPEIFISAKKGDIVLFSSLMLHQTKQNRTNNHRWAYVIEYMSVEHYDPLVSGPYFIASESGQPANRFNKSLPGKRKLKNRLKYVGIETTQLRANLLKKFGKALSKT